MNSNWNFYPRSRAGRLLLLGSLTASPFLQALDGPEERSDKAGAQMMREVVVTSTRTEKELGDAPGTVNVITADSMKKRGVKDVDEALNTTAGVITSRSKGPMDTLAGIALRGIPDSGRTLVLVDGLTLNDPYSNGVNFAGIAAEDLDRIEVVKGPFSSLYGGNAMGGVVNILTRMPTRRQVNHRIHRNLLQPPAPSFPAGVSLSSRFCPKLLPAQTHRLKLPCPDLTGHLTDV